MSMKSKVIIISIIIFLLTAFFIYLKPSIKTIPKNFDYQAYNLNLDEYEFVIENNIDLNNLKLYQKYRYFNIYNYFEYEDIRLTNNYTHLESINYFRYPSYFKPYQNIKKALFIDTPLTLVNKSFFLSNEYIPSNLVSVMNYEIEYTNSEIVLKKEVLDKLELMNQAAKKDGLNLVIFSGYRSYQRQEYLFYNIYNDDTISAKPGHSEHQTGYAVDLSLRNIGLTAEFEYTKTYEWLILNSFNYGFILRYPKDKENITTYIFEPWHFRYVGEIAKKLTKDHLTLEEYIFSNLEI